MIPFEYGVEVVKGSTITLNIQLQRVYTDLEGTEDFDSSKEVGTIRGNVYTAKLKVVKGLKLYLGGIGETITDDNGYFEFIDVPVGEYELYTVLKNGKKYVLKTVQIKKDVDILTKLKYDPESEDADALAGTNNKIWVVIIIIAIVAIAAAGVTILLFVLKAKKKNKI